MDSEEEYDTVHVIAENEKVVGKLTLQFMNTLYSYYTNRHCVDHADIAKSLT